MAPPAGAVIGGLHRHRCEHDRDLRSLECQAGRCSLHGAPPFLLEVDPIAGAALHIANVELGYGKFSSDGSRLAIRSFRGNHVHIHDLGGALVSSLPLTPRLASGHKDPSFEDLDGRDLWLQTNDSVFHIEMG